MKLDFLAEGSDDCPLVRLWDFTPSEAVRLHEELTALALGQVRQVALHELPFMMPLGECRFTLLASTRDEGVVLAHLPADCECRFTAESWDNVAGLVEPFTRDACGFQWLSFTGGGDVKWLISAEGRW